MPDSRSKGFARQKGPGTVLLSICLFLVIWGVKIGVVDRYGSDIPNWDQWDAVGDQLLLPYLRGELTPVDLFRAHNEHRIALTRALALGLVIINGQWDARLECMLNAALHACFAVGWYLFGRRLLPASWHTAWLISVAVLVAPPYSWHNVTGGFASQQYLLLGLSTFGIGFLIVKEPWTLGWWMGVVCVALSLVTMASGLLAAVAILLSLGLLALRHRSRLRDEAVTLLACGAIVLVGALLYQPFAGHQPLQAASIKDFVLTFWRSLQWPVTALPLFPLFAWLPFVGLTAKVFRDHMPDRRELAVFVVGIWILLQFAAAAYARGSGAPFPSSRYLDTSLVGIGTVALSGLVLLTKYPVTERFRLSRICAFGAWAGLMGAGLGLSLNATVRDTLPAIGSGLHQREVSTRAYLWTDDASQLSGREIPYPNASHLIDRLQTEEIRSILPASIRLPERLSGDAAPPQSFVTGGIPDDVVDVPPAKVWGSFSASGASSMGTWTSDPIRSVNAGWLRFEIAGSTKNNQVSLAITDRGEAPSRQFFAAALVPGRWTSVFVPASKAPLTLIAIDQDPDGWIAFSPPTQMAPLSFWAAAISHRGFSIAILSATFAATILLWSALEVRRGH